MSRAHTGHSRNLLANHSVTAVDRQRGPHLEYAEHGTFRGGTAWTNHLAGHLLQWPAWLTTPTHAPCCITGTCWHGCQYAVLLAPCQCPHSGIPGRGIKRASVPRCQAPPSTLSHAPIATLLREPPSFSVEGKKGSPQRVF